MDNSKEYLLMCDKSEEIQSMKKCYEDFVDGDYVFVKTKDKIVIHIQVICEAFNRKENIKRTDAQIFLPRQDQLVDYLEKLTIGYKYPVARIADIIKQYTDGARSYFDTLEKILLCIYMHKLRNKIWDIENKDWKLLGL